MLCHLCGNIYTSICVSKAVQLELQHIHNKSKYVAYFLIRLMCVLLINNMCSKIIYLATFIIHILYGMHYDHNVDKVDPFTFIFMSKLLAFSALTCLQCFDAVGWAAGRAPGL